MSLAHVVPAKNISIVTVAVPKCKKVSV